MEHGKSPRFLRLLRPQVHRMPYVKWGELKHRQSVRGVENDMSLGEDAWHRSREGVQSISISRHSNKMIEVDDWVAGQTLNIHDMMITAAANPFS